MTVRVRILLFAMAPVAALAALAAVATGGPAGTSVGAAAHTVMARLVHSASSNWSGYTSTKGGFTSVSASWKEPAVKCGTGASYSSFWIGIDGDGSNSVEQTGSESDCKRSAGNYFAWYEMYPAAPVNFNNTVKPGDAFSASVTASGSAFTLKISDTTQGWSHTVNQTSTTAQDHSAEIIAEAPSSCSVVSCRVLPLANFGTVNFTASVANGKSIGSQSPDEIVMETSTGTVKAQPSALTSGENFSVTWHHK